METITIRVRRAGAIEVQRLELCGHRLLGGHADTGIFRIVDNEGASARVTRPPANSVRTTRREDDDGLATATIEIDKPLAVAEVARCTNPYDRGGNFRR